MKCVQCNQTTRVLSSRRGKRLRECATGHRFFTQELPTDKKPGRPRKARAPQPAPPGGLLAAAWHSVLLSSADKP
jgi:hypothetical protein